MSNDAQVLSGGLPRPFGKYVLVRMLGRGAMGIVYEAQDKALGRRVALKLSVPPVHASEEEAARDDAYFVREAQMSARLPKHPNLVTVYDAGVEEGRRYLALEYLEARPLSEWTEERRPELRARVKILRDVALAVHHAHEGGVLHRDLKPGNVLVDAQGRPYVGDFGMAKPASAEPGASSTSAGLVVGTPSYMSPEQAQGLKAVDRRTDVYALGAMLYEILVGKPPFPGEMTIVALMRIVQDPIPAPSTVSPGWAASTADKSIETLCMQALSKKPDERPPTALAFADRLSAWLGEATRDRLRRADTAAPAPRRPKGPWLVAAAFTAAAAALLLRPDPKEPLSFGAPLPARDLLAHVDPGRDAAGGTWTRDGAALAGTGAPLARLVVPWRPTADYDLRATVVPAPGATELLLHLNREGRSAAVRVEIGPTAKLHAGTASLDIRGGVPPGKPLPITVKIRADAVLAVLGDQTLEWKTPWEGLTPGPDWSPADPTLLALGVRGGSATFRELGITEYSARK